MVGPVFVFEVTVFDCFEVGEAVEDLFSVGEFCWVYEVGVSGEWSGLDGVSPEPVFVVEETWVVGSVSFGWVNHKLFMCRSGSGKNFIGFTVDGHGLLYHILLSQVGDVKV